MLPQRAPPAVQLAVIGHNTSDLFISIFAFELLLLSFYRCIFYTQQTWRISSARQRHTQYDVPWTKGLQGRREKNWVHNSDTQCLSSAHAGPCHSSLENLPPCRTISARQDVKRTHERNPIIIGFVQPLDAVPQQWRGLSSGVCSKIVGTFSYTLATEFCNCSLFSAEFRYQYQFVVFSLHSKTKFLLYVCMYVRWVCSL